MGKYMRRKSKNSGEISPIDVPSLGGVLTRSQARALQKSANSGGSGSYIQLRSRRLEKPRSPKRQRGGNSARVRVHCVEKLGENCEVKGDEGEGSIGENVLEIEGRERESTTRESTPCSLIRDPDTIRTPGSSTKPTKSSDRKCNRPQDIPARPVPLTIEMEEFFTGPEKQQQKNFMEKYNFDPVNEKPLRGRYEWVKVDNSHNQDTKKI